MILNWYIFRQTFSNVLTSTLVFVGIIWLSQSFKNIKLIVNKGADLSDFFISVINQEFVTCFLFLSIIMDNDAFSSHCECIANALRMHSQCIRNAFAMT